MPTRLHLFAVPLLLVAAPAAAQSPFNGKWKGELTSATVQAKPSSYSLKDGTYSCSSCTPAYTVKADGKPQAVAGMDYWDDVAITVVDDRTIKHQFRKDGRAVADATSTVSADGATLTRASRNTNNGGNVPIESTSSTTRVGAPVAGAHLISGEWKANTAASTSDAALTMEVAVTGDTLRMTTGLGETLEAKIGGDYAPNQGDPGKTMTKVEQIAPNVLKMTDMRAGKVAQVSTYTVGADGVMRGEWSDPQSGATGTFIARKQ